MRWGVAAAIFTMGVALGCGSDADETPAVPGHGAGRSPSSSSGSAARNASSSGEAPSASSSSGATTTDAGAVDDPAAGAPYPIVFLHGMAGFVSAGTEPFELVYFAGVLDDLEAIGEHDVYATVASPYAASWDRAHEIAPQLAAILTRTGKRKVNLVAHSQGGLDARLLASPHGLGYGDRIASVTTVSTPHRGTHVADLALDVLGEDHPSAVDPGVELLVQLLGRNLYDLPASAKSDLRKQLLDLSETQMANVWNPTYVDDPGVLYESYAGRTNLRRGEDACAGSELGNPDALDATAPLLQPTATLLEGNPLAPVVNDGLVPVQSARYGNFVSCLAADHMDEIGQSALAPFDHLAFYRSVVARLRAKSL